MNDSVHKTAKPEKMVVDNCAERFSVTKDCMLFQQHRRFTGCKLDSSCVTKALPPLILLYAWQVFNKQSGVDGGKQVINFAKVYRKAVQAIEVSKRLDVWEVPERLSPMQTFQPHILYHLETYLSKLELFQKEGMLQ